MNTIYIQLLVLPLLITTLFCRTDELHNSNDIYDVRIGSSVTVDSDDELLQHIVKVTEHKNGESFEIKWMDHAAVFTDVFIHKNYAVIYGRLIDQIDTISIIDLLHRRLQTFIICRKPSISPDTRYIAYLQFRPLHPFSEDAPDLVGLYDLDSAESHKDISRSSKGWVWSSASHGTIIFPAERSGQKITLPDPTILNITAYIESGLFWTSDSKKLMLVANYKSGHNFVLIDIQDNKATGAVKMFNIDGYVSGRSKSSGDSNNSAIEIADIQVISGPQILLVLKDSGDGRREIKIPLPK